MLTLLVTTFLSLTPALAADNQPKPDPMRFARGAKAWVDNCSRCHNLRSPKEFSDEKWETIVHQMRVRANISGNTSDDIVAFLKASN
jgi:nitrate/TMAO reductase-like tetraheme cytochrome c subunit